MNVVFNKEANQWEAKETGLLLEILAPERMNVNNKGYRLALVELTYPDNTKETVTGSIWSASLEAHPDKFIAGSKVGLAINIDRNSEYQGNIKIELPGGRADVSRLLKGQELPEAMKTSIAKPITEKV
jgi:hypothetical protein